MLNYIRNLSVKAVITSLLMAASVLVAQPGHAALKCEELVSKRICSDNASRSLEYAPGQSAMVGAPVIEGYNAPCWSWTRKFQCIETEPVMTCESKAPFQNVKNSCSLTAAAINSTISINGLSFITSADYTYRCGWQDFQTTEQLPEGKECVLLDGVTTDVDTIPGAPVGSEPSTGWGNPPTTTDPNTGTVVVGQERDEQYVCYSKPVTTCTDTCYEQVVDPATGTIAQKPVPCESPVTNCQVSSDQCVSKLITQPDGTVTSEIELGPDGRCVKSEASSMCTGGEIPKCLSLENCTLSATTPTNVQDNGVAMGQEQTYVCTNETKSCAESTTVSNCVHAGAWGWDNLSIKNQIGEGLGEANQAMAKMEGIQKGLKNNDPHIFSGQDLRCRIPVGNFWNTVIMAVIAIAVIVMSGGAATGPVAGMISSGASAAASAGVISAQTAAMIAANANVIAGAISVANTAAQDAENSKAFNSDCCKEFIIEGSDKWYKLGSCTAEEVKLSVARRKGLTHYLGEYCSKKGGFPLKQCVERTRTYCAFDDMLALVVNEQGRSQLNALAAADPTTTKATGEKEFQLYSPLIETTLEYKGMNNGKWVLQADESRSQIWTWQYPGYCMSEATQKAAYDLYTADVNKMLDLKGIKPDQMNKAEAAALMVAMVGMPAFQECPSTPGMMSYMTCSKNDDSCDVTKLPEGPTGIEVDITGEDVSESDVDWRVQQARSFYKPGDYGVTALMPGNNEFAAVTSTVNEFISATGSCHTDGNCLYNFSITDKVTTGGLGARKRTKDYAQFPLYTIVQNSAWPAVDYVPKDGNMDPASYFSDINRGRADPMVVNTQRFIFHPNYLAGTMEGNMHSHVLMEYANENTDVVYPEKDYSPLLVPTSLPEATEGWYPYGDPAVKGKNFYLSGGCDPGSRWCNYAIEVDLNVPLHPWGDARSPRCWGFTLEQMAALDFDKMDLSRWINSLDLSAASNGLSSEAATAMTDQVTKSAQSFYGAFKDGAAINKPGPGTNALVTNTDILPYLHGHDFATYTLEVAVPSNWPNYFHDQPNTNPVSNAKVDWGDGTESVMQIGPGGTAFLQYHDYGDHVVGRYKVTVTLDTAHNGPQKLTTFVTVTPNEGGTPEVQDFDGFDNPGTNGAVQGQYTPSDAPNGVNMSQENVKAIAPGAAVLFDAQGNEVSK